MTPDQFSPHNKFVGEVGLATGLVFTISEIKQTLTNLMSLMPSALCFHLLVLLKTKGLPNNYNNIGFLFILVIYWSLFVITYSSLLYIIRQL